MGTAMVGVSELDIRLRGFDSPRLHNTFWLYLLKKELPYKALAPFSLYVSELDGTIIANSRIAINF